ncbi:zinc-binding dehydrogenase [Nocardia sp. CA2R105]|uniref:zinc-binding dehydrogenase n=1 Tax=Nocardia coffeae TaxID=2873381 RepID=UPI001CA745AB|nr:zinc-binding dehydrogenase [Nocardia coffeae]MBY8863367.1 zinc-binding dehydrogenase [Nocardia coffeae]
MPHVVELTEFLEHGRRTRIVETPSAPIQADEVRVRVRAAGLNFWQVMQLRGQVHTEPGQALGTEGAGIVAEVGATVTSVAVGDSVAWTRVPGSFADEVVAPAEAFYLVPDGVDDRTAAALLFQGMTAHYLAVDGWPLREGSTAVVTSAAGGVGLLLIQLLVARGVEVIGVVSSPEKKDLVQSVGARHVLFYSDDLAEQIRLIIPGGVSAVYDAVGGDVARKLVESLAVQGALVLYGAASGEEADIPLDALGSGSRYLTRTQGRHFTGDPAVAARRTQELFALVADGTLHVHIGQTRPLEEAERALEMLADRRSTGKVLLIP